MEKSGVKLGARSLRRLYGSCSLVPIQELTSTEVGREDPIGVNVSVVTKAFLQGDFHFSPSCVLQFPASSGSCQSSNHHSAASNPAPSLHTEGNSVVLVLLGMVDAVTKTWHGPQNHIGLGDMQEAQVSWQAVTVAEFKTSLKLHCKCLNLLLILLKTLNLPHFWQAFSGSLKSPRPGKLLLEIICFVSLVSKAVSHDH